MKPRTRTEKEVMRLSRCLPPLADRYKKKAESHIDYGKAYMYRGHKTHIIHFIVVTTKSNWQVLRHFYLYATFKYKKLADVSYLECMQQWMKDGKYVFMARNRQMGYCNDAWCQGQPMSIKKNYYHCYVQSDPRTIGYDMVIYARVQDRFAYLPADTETTLRVDKMFQAVNISPMWETIIKTNPMKFEWFDHYGFVTDKEKSVAAKIALRHKYPFATPEWADLIDILKYLGKDLHNPYYVCPLDLKSMHDEMSVLAANKRKKIHERMTKVRQLQDERKELMRIEKEKKAIEFFTKKRKKFFGLIIAGKGFEIKVLQSVGEFMEEGAAMSHCVFSNGYYDLEKHPDSLIMSARKDGERIETIEVDIADYRIVQSRGKHNSVTPYHDTIVSLVNDNMAKIMELNTHRKKKAV